MPTIEQLGLIIANTTHISIESSAKEILSQIDLGEVTAQDIIESIRPFRQTRKGLEQCCQTLMAIYRRKNLSNDPVDLRDESDWTGLLGTNPFYKP